jgi:titin
LYCLVTFLAIASAAASAQNSVNAGTHTIQFAGTPDVTSLITGAKGGIVLYGTATNPDTSQPVRHLWVADGAAGICRVDPDLDSPGPFAINHNSCPLSSTKVTGGGMAFDPANNFLYFVDNRSATRGVFRIQYVPQGDGGNGSFDFSSTFSLGGNSTTDVFPGGQTGCALPGNPSLPNSAALDPQGNLWIGFGRSGAIIRFNNPAAATATAFGTCQDFIQVVASTPDKKRSNGLAWIGHDLWSVDSKSPFFIRNADTSCLVTPNAVCTDKSATSTLTAIGGANAMAGDQVYPATNGNNLYFALAAPANVAWVGNVTGAAAGQSLDLTYIDPAQIPATGPLSGIGALVVDGTDPANLVLYTADDPSGLGTAGAGRLFQTSQTAAAPDVPGAPLDVVAVEIGTNAILSWSPAQVAQPVTSYTVRNNFASNGLPLADATVIPANGGLYPPTSITIPGLAAGVVYQFQVLASNAQGSSPLSTPSNSVPLGITLPGVPGAVGATAGDAQAAVSWTLPQSVNGITSYTVTARINGVATAISATVPAPAPGSSTGSAVVSGLSNGTAYTFTVHASNAAGNGFESAPSLPVTPLITNVPNTTIVVNGPSGVAAAPAQITYGIVLTNASLFPIQNVSVNNILSSVDGAFIISIQPDAGACTAVGAGVTQTICSVASMAPGQVLNISVVAQMNGATITDTAVVTGFDANGSSLTFSKAFRTTQPSLPPPPPTTQVPVSVSGSATPSTVKPGSTGILTWTVGNNSSTAANNVVFTITIDSILTINSVTVTPSAGATPASCGAPAPGLGGNVIVCTIASLGGPPVNGVAAVQKMIVTVGITAPNPANLQLLPSGTVTFDGIDSSNPTGTIVLRIH